MKNYKRFRMAIAIIETILMAAGVIAVLLMAYAVYMSIPVFD